MSFLRPTHFSEVIDSIQGHLRPLLEWLDLNSVNGAIPNIDYISSIDLASGQYPVEGQYRLFMTAGHDEYWSDTMVNTIVGHLANGGNVMFLSGNTSDGRITFGQLCKREACPAGPPHVDALSTMSTINPSARHPGGDGKERWSSVDNMDMRLTGLRTPTANTARCIYEPYTISNLNHWAMKGVSDLCFGRLLDGGWVSGYEVDSRFAEADQYGEFEILGSARWNNEILSGDHRGPAVTTHFGLCHNYKGTAFSAGTVDWVRGLAKAEFGRGVETVTRNVIRRLSGTDG